MSSSIIGMIIIAADHTTQQFLHMWYFNILPICNETYIYIYIINGSTNYTKHLGNLISPSAFLLLLLVER